MLHLALSSFSFKKYIYKYVCVYVYEWCFHFADCILISTSLNFLNRFYILDGHVYFSTV